MSITVASKNTSQFIHQQLVVWNPSSNHPFHQNHYEKRSQRVAMGSSAKDRRNGSGPPTMSSLSVSNVNKDLPNFMDGSNQ
jgi:nicotinic acid mononucleotide adenylyltransferase